MIQFEDITDLFTIKWDELRQHLRVLEATMPRAGGKYFGGWSVLSSDETYQDGWTDWSIFYEKNGDALKFNEVEARKNGYTPPTDAVKFTNAASPEIINLIEQIRELGLSPHRARITQLSPAITGTRHTDGVKHKLALRLHVVIETNPDAAFITDDEVKHLEQDRVYLINVNEYHLIRNLGSDIRTHLIMDVFDTKQVSKLHK